MSSPHPATAAPPSRDDSETTHIRTCPVCDRPFTPIGRQRYCQPSCRKTADRRRHAAIVEVTMPLLAVSRPQRTIYQCPDCDGLQLGVQRCVECGIFGRSLGLGGHCPHCDEPVTLLDLDLTTA